MPESVDDEIARLRSEVRAREDRISDLEKLRSHPHVIPVKVYMRYFSEYRDDHDWDDEWDLVRAAYQSLEWAADDGHCAPIGVEVGGLLIKQNDLRTRYGRVYDDD